MAILRANGSFLKANGKILVRPENKIDPDIVILQDWVTQDVGLQPTGGVPSIMHPTRFDPNGPFDVSGTGWEGTPYITNEDLGYTDVRVPSGTYDTNFPLYAANQYRYEQGITPYEFYTQGVDFTFEAWLRYAAQRGNLSYLRYQPLIGLFNASTGISVGVQDSGIAFFDANGRRISQNSSLSGWHHYAVVVHNNSAAIYVDGVRWGSDYPIVSSGMTFFSIAKRGLVNWAGSTILMAKYDYAQICLTKRAKWLENFTPPTRPYCLGMEE